MKTEVYNDTSPSGELYLDARLLNSLYEAAKWGKLLAVLGFVFAGLILVLGLFVQQYNGTPATGSTTDVGLSGFTTLLYAFVALVYFFPSLYLYSFSSRLHQGVKERKQEQLERAIRKLKILFKFMSIMLLLFLVLVSLSLLMVATGTSDLQL